MKLITLKGLWEKERKLLNEDMKNFDKEYMVKNKDHSCDSKETFDDGSWYCNHLVNARIRRFKDRLEREDKLLYNLLYSQSEVG